jgi:hypothetical protein
MSGTVTTTTVSQAIRRIIFLRPASFRWISMSNPSEGWQLQCQLPAALNHIQMTWVLGIQAQAGNEKGVR